MAKHVLEEREEIDFHDSGGDKNRRRESLPGLEVDGTVDEGYHLGNVTFEVLECRSEKKGSR